MHVTYAKRTPLLYDSQDQLPGALRSSSYTGLLSADGIPSLSVSGSVTLPVLRLFV